MTGLSPCPISPQRKGFIIPRHDGRTINKTRPKHKAHRMKRRTRQERKLDRLRGGRKAIN